MSYWHFGQYVLKYVRGDESCPNSTTKNSISSSSVQSKTPSTFWSPRSATARNFTCLPARKQLVLKFPDILFRTQKNTLQFARCFFGAVEQIRTVDLFLTKEVLCLLSYNSIFSLSPKKKWRPGWGSNPRPLAWQASALTNWATGPSGGSYRARTCDPLLVRQMLSQLS